jgi:hypothetical protein
MKRFPIVLVLFLLTLPLMGSQCETGQEDKDRAVVQQQQEQYAIGQPIPTFNWSLERDLLIQLYNLRNDRVSTYSVWRSDYGMVEGDCASLGYGLPYDTSLTNPMMATGVSSRSLTSIGQAEPNGVFASTNTAATWVMCVDVGGTIAPVYIESHVTVYPWPMSVDYETNRVTKAGEATVQLKVGKKEGR